MGIKGLTEPRRRVLSIALLENAAFKYGYDRIDEYAGCEGNEWGTQEDTNWLDHRLARTARKHDILGDWDWANVDPNTDKTWYSRR